MEPDEFMFHWDNLRNLDPDDLVNDLQITSEEILDAFAERAEEFIHKEFG